MDRFVIDRDARLRIGAPRYNGVPKRLLDLAVLLAAHLILLPIWLLLWGLIPLLILVDDGPPVFYRQRRIGRNRKALYVVKFRTMVRNADRIGPAWTKRGDTRLTRVGRLLRGTALDELPQLVHILRGEMSFVGPRALAEEEFRELEKEVPGFAKRLALRPGLTGMAQVYVDRDDASSKIAYDLKYAEEISLWLDMKLLFLSTWITTRGKWEKLGRKI